MEKMAETFQKRITSREQRRTTALNSLSTIISRNKILLRGEGPRYVSIGPLHRGKPHLDKMEDHKWWLMYILQFQTVKLEDVSSCFEGLKGLEERTRQTYSEMVNASSDEFVQMLLLDACFIICLVTGKAIRVEPSNNLPPPEPNVLPGGSHSCHEPSSSLAPNLSPPQSPSILSSAAPNMLATRDGHPDAIVSPLFDFGELVLKEIDIDLTMLDNQIPFFVLKHVWKWLMDCFHWEASEDLIPYLCTYFLIPPDRQCRFPKEIHHILHFLHCSTIPQKLQQIRQNDGRKHWMPSASELKEAGIGFRLNETPYSFLDVKFLDGIINIPTIYITERQRLRLQNFVDFEQSVLGITTHFTNFVRFMKCLLSKEKDVRIISMEGIIENNLGSDKEVQEFFQNLHRSCCYNWHGDTFLDEVFIQINNHRASRRERWKASFRRNYCHNPWVIVSVVGVIVLFILTFLQSFFAVYSYFHPPT